MTSMTGYAFREAEFTDFTLSVEFKGYNNRFLDIGFTLPAVLQMREPDLRRLVAQHVNRGRVEVAIRLRESVRAQYHADPEVVGALVEALASVREYARLGGALELGHLLAFPEILRQKPSWEPGQVWDTCLPLILSTLEEFQESRLKEGKNLKASIQEQVAALRRGLISVASLAEAAQKDLHRQLVERVRQLEVDVEPSRVAAEVALYVIRMSIQEELARLESHLNTFEEWLGQSAPVGKKLDFLCQEVAREVNTLSSKATLVEIQRTAVEMKDAVENIREQLRNVE